MTNVSRETSDKLQAYADLVRRWGRTINLVARRDLDCLYERHIADSLQIAQFRGQPKAGAISGAVEDSPGS